ncbi:hypothetical protein GCM10027061_12460 [Nesterenkonia suensis]
MWRNWPHAELRSSARIAVRARGGRLVRVDRPCLVGMMGQTSCYHPGIVAHASAGDGGVRMDIPHVGHGPGPD